MNSIFLKQRLWLKAAVMVVSVIFLADGCTQKDTASHQPLSASTGLASAPDDLSVIARAYHNKESGIFVTIHGFVGRVLEDDAAPPRHQKFIVRLINGQTLLITHNIDLAPRVDGLKTNDSVYFRGQYEWSEKGGTVHKTHRDPSGRLPGGWIEHSGKRFE